ncbi:MAG TPA: YqhA family protein, partial [Acetobacteraceae bacterium]|nr:YqhA family protein [Acetobacteraceae bacterium]
MQTILDKAILASRWILAVFLLGLAVALALFAARFLMKVAKFAGSVLGAPEEQVLLDLLHLLDWALVASLIVMVAVASWDSLVNPLSKDGDGGRFGWIRKLDP